MKNTTTKIIVSDAKAFPKAYRVYAKLEGQKKFSPLGDGQQVINLIYANIYTVNNQAKKEEFDAWVNRLNQDNDGIFEARPVDGWL